MLENLKFEITALSVVCQMSRNNRLSNLRSREAQTGGKKATALFWAMYYFTYCRYTLVYSPVSMFVYSVISSLFSWLARVCEASSKASLVEKVVYAACDLNLIPPWLCNTIGHLAIGSFLNFTTLIFLIVATGVPSAWEKILLLLWLNLLSLSVVVFSHCVLGSKTVWESDWNLTDRVFVDGIHTPWGNASHGTQ